MTWRSLTLDFHPKVGTRTSSKLARKGGKFTSSQTNHILQWVTLYWRLMYLGVCIHVTDHEPVNYTVEYIQSSCWTFPLTVP